MLRCLRTPLHACQEVVSRDHSHPFVRRVQRLVARLQGVGLRVRCSSAVSIDLSDSTLSSFYGAVGPLVGDNYLGRPGQDS